MTWTNTAATDGVDIADQGHASIKGTLFCQSCGYEAPWNAGWLVSTGSEYREVHCPHCGMQVA